MITDTEIKTVIGSEPEIILKNLGKRARSTDLAGSSFVWDTAKMVVSKIESEAGKEHGRESGMLNNIKIVKDDGSGSSDHT